MRAVGSESLGKRLQRSTGSRTGPSRGMLGQERVDTLVEIGAAVAASDEVVAGVLGNTPVGLNPAHHLLGRANGQRCVGGHRLRVFLHDRVERVSRGDTVHQARGKGLVGVEEPPGEEQLLEPGRTNEVEQPRVIRGRQAVSEGAGDRDAEA